MTAAPLSPFVKEGGRAVLRLVHPTFKRAPFEYQTGLTKGNYQLEIGGVVVALAPCTSAEGYEMTPGAPFPQRPGMPHISPPVPAR
jgi:hypothetical protein